MAVSLDRFMFKEKTIYKMASFLVPIARKLKETTARMTQILAFKTFGNRMAFGLTSLDFEPQLWFVIQVQPVHRDLNNRHLIKIMDIGIYCFTYQEKLTFFNTDNLNLLIHLN